MKNFFYLLLIFAFGQQLIAQTLSLPSACSTCQSSPKFSTINGENCVLCSIVYYLNKGSLPIVSCTSNGTINMSSNGTITGPPFLYNGQNYGIEILTYDHETTKENVKNIIDCLKKKGTITFNKTTGSQNPVYQCQIGAQTTNYYADKCAQNYFKYYLSNPLASEFYYGPDNKVSPLPEVIQLMLDQSLKSGQLPKIQIMPTCDKKNVVKYANNGAVSGLPYQYNNILPGLFNVTGFINPTNIIWNFPPYVNFLANIYHQNLTTMMRCLLSNIGSAGNILQFNNASSGLPQFTCLKPDGTTGSVTQKYVPTDPPFICGSQTFGSPSTNTACILNSFCANSDQNCSNAKFCITNSAAANNAQAQNQYAAGGGWMSCSNAEQCYLMSADVGQAASGLNCPSMSLNPYCSTMPDGENNPSGYCNMPCFNNGATGTCYCGTNAQGQKIVCPDQVAPPAECSADFAKLNTIYNPLWHYPPYFNGNCNILRHAPNAAKYYLDPSVPGSFMDKDNISAIGNVSNSGGKSKGIMTLQGCNYPGDSWCKYLSTSSLENTFPIGSQGAVLDTGCYAPQNTTGSQICTYSTNQTSNQLGSCCQPQCWESKCTVQGKSQYINPLCQCMAAGWNNSIIINTDQDYTAGTAVCTNLFLSTNANNGQCAYGAPLSWTNIDGVNRAINVIDKNKCYCMANNPLQIEVGQNPYFTPITNLTNPSAQGCQQSVAAAGGLPIVCGTNTVYWSTNGTSFDQSTKLSFDQSNKYQQPAGCYLQCCLPGGAVAGDDTRYHFIGSLANLDVQNGVSEPCFNMSTALGTAKIASICGTTNGKINYISMASYANTAPGSNFTGPLLVGNPSHCYCQHIVGNNQQMTDIGSAGSNLPNGLPDCMGFATSLTNLKTLCGTSNPEINYFNGNGYYYVGYPNGAATPPPPPPPKQKIWQTNACYCGTNFYTASCLGPPCVGSNLTGTHGSPPQQGTPPLGTVKSMTLSQTCTYGTGSVKQETTNACLCNAFQSLPNQNSSTTISFTGSTCGSNKYCQCLYNNPNIPGANMFFYSTNGTSLDQSVKFYPNALGMP
jgi:hypothetical protein